LSELFTHYTSQAMQIHQMKYFIQRTFLDIVGARM